MERRELEDTEDPLRPIVSPPGVPNGCAWFTAAGLFRNFDTSTNGNEFYMQKEDFPALPKASSVDLTGEDRPASAPVEKFIESRAKNDSLIPTDPIYGGIQIQPDGTVKNIPPGMLTDQFGLAAMVSCLRTVNKDQATVALVFGIDVTSLGIDIRSTEGDVIQKFGGPWSDGCCKAQDVDVKVPEDYLTNSAVRDRLPNIRLNKLSEDVLFYIFYNYPQEVYQIAAALELYNRDWRYHKGSRSWVTRSQYGGVKEQSLTLERGSYYVFDPVQWRKIPKEMTLEYSELEEKPKMPDGLKAEMWKGNPKMTAEQKPTTSPALLNGNSK